MSGGGARGEEGNAVWLQKGNRREPRGDRDVLQLNCVNVSTLVIMGAEFCKVVPLEQTG